MRLLSALQRQFQNAADFTIRPLRVAGIDCALCFIDGLVAGAEVGEQVIRPLLGLEKPSIAPHRFRGAPEAPPGPVELLDRVLMAGAQTAVCVPVSDLPDGESRLLNGFCLLVIPGAGAAAFEVKSGEKRGISEPEVESTTRGPKDAFTETARSNTALVRRHLRTARLGLWETTVGRESRTGVSLLWLEGLTDPETVARMKARLRELDTEDLLTPAAAEHLLPGRRRTAFPLLQATERTDKLAAGLLAGRVGIFVDGLPVGYLAPVDLGYLLQSAEDKDTDFLSARFLKALRLAALGLALLLPGLYIAMAAFHQEMLPTKLLEAIIQSKQEVPFPTVLEVLGLLLAFELLQEAGLSAPKTVAQPVSIIGGLVVGTAAVEARLISPAALIVVSAAGICGFALPGKSFPDAVRLCRLGLALCAALAGLFGLTLGLLALLLHLGELTSFHRSYLAPFSELKKRTPAS